MGTTRIAPNPLAALKVLLVDDEVQHLELRAAVMKAHGFSVITTSNPVETISIVTRETETIDIAILDYDMPVMNGCLLANCLRSAHPELKIILYSGAIDIPDNEMSNVDVFISKSDGMVALLEQIGEFAQDPSWRRQLRAQGLAGSVGIRSATATALS